MHLAMQAPQPSMFHRRQEKKAATLILSEEMECDIGEWYESQPMLYDKGHRDHKDAAKKKRLFAEKAAQLGGEFTGKT